MENVTFEEMLKAKEERSQLQAELRNRYKTTVASVTINMPGKIKYTPDTVSLLHTAMNSLRQQFAEAGFPLREERIYHLPTGPLGLIAVEGDAAVVKILGIMIEEEHKYGRMLDIDVFDEQGLQINRALLGVNERGCLVCSQDAVHCIRTQAHKRSELSSAVQQLLTNYRAEQTKRWPTHVHMIGKSALEAMLMEVSCTPAPGLVDRKNSGAHQDMDFFTFIKSSTAIQGALYRCAMAGWQFDGPAEELLPILRNIGIEAEKEMFLATEGVNTHKGMLFLLGIISAATSRCLRNQPVKLTHHDILREASIICQGIVKRELASLKHKRTDRKLTAGERYYLEHGVTGVRGEIESGLPSVLVKGLPAFREALHKGLSINDALVHALIGIMSIVEDTTILNRHDIETLQAVQEDAQTIVKLGGMLTQIGQRRIRQLDKEYTQRGISPGGAADLLAVTYFLHVIEERYQPDYASHNRLFSMRYTKP